MENDMSEMLTVHAGQSLLHVFDNLGQVNQTGHHSSFITTIHSFQCKQNGLWTSQRIHHTLLNISAKDKSNWKSFLFTICVHIIIMHTCTVDLHHLLIHVSMYQYVCMLNVYLEMQSAVNFCFVRGVVFLQTYSMISFTTTPVSSFSSSSSSSATFFHRQKLKKNFPLWNHLNQNKLRMREGYTGTMKKFKLQNLNEQAKISKLNIV